MGTVRIPLNSRKHPDLVTIIDQEDYERVSRYRWNAVRSRHTWYARHDFGIHRKGGPRFMYLHRFLMDHPDGLVDHRNRDGLDNRRENLRITDRYGNSRNVPPFRDGLKGVMRERTGRWRAQISCHGITHHLGVYESEGLAGKAYDAAAREMFGEFAYLNFPLVDTKGE